MWLGSFLLSLRALWHSELSCSVASRSRKILLLVLVIISRVWTPACSESRWSESEGCTRMCDLFNSASLRRTSLFSSRQDRRLIRRTRSFQHHLNRRQVFLRKRRDATWIYRCSLRPRCNARVRFTECFSSYLTLAGINASLDRLEHTIF